MAYLAFSRIKKYYQVLLLTLLLVPNLAFADLNTSISNINTLESSTGVQEFATLTDLFMALLKWALGFLGILAVAAIIYGGVVYITSVGDEKKAEKGKMIILYTVIGIIVVGGAAVVVNFIITLVQ